MWALEATAGPRAIGPDEVAWTEAALSSLDGTALSGGRRLDTVVVLVGHVRAIAQQTAAAPAASGGAEVRPGAVLTELVRDRADRYPAVAAALASAAEGGQDQALDFGLDVILDGLAARTHPRA